MTRVCDKQGMRNINVSTILRVFLSQEIVSQTELVNSTGLKKATVSNIVNSLKKERLLTEAGEGTSGSSGGRKQQLLSINKTSVIAFGSALRGFTLKSCLLNLKGEILWSNESEFDENHSSKWLPVLIKDIRSAKELLKKSHVFIGVGFSAGGVYDPVTQAFMQFSHQEGGRVEKNVPVKSIIEKEFPGDRITTDDFPNAMAIGEFMFGSAKNLDDFVLLQLANLKAAIVSNKTIFRGFGGYAGQVGGWRYGDQILRLALLNGGYTTELLTDFCTNILIGYAPEKIILSRENIPEKISVDIPEINRRLKERFSEYGFSEYIKEPVAISTLGKEERASGAAALVFDSYFNSNMLLM
ncbi:MAG: ROK family transcriptional regulator [Fibrobacteres bacterium]|nr:ROK family transcriptional regulator [Fibrobacterota bacterium]